MSLIICTFAKNIKQLKYEENNDAAAYGGNDNQRFR